MHATICVRDDTPPQAAEAAGAVPVPESDEPRATVSDAELDAADAIIARLLVADWRRRKQEEREADS
jgi:hypothetical protein